MEKEEIPENWEQWKTEFQKLMYEEDMETQYIKMLSDEHWQSYFMDLSSQGMTPKEGLDYYLDELIYN